MYGKRQVGFRPVRKLQRKAMIHDLRMSWNRIHVLNGCNDPRRFLKKSENKELHPGALPGWSTYGFCSSCGSLQVSLFIQHQVAWLGPTGPTHQRQRRNLVMTAMRDNNGHNNGHDRSSKSQCCQESDINHLHPGTVGSLQPAVENL